MNERVLEQRLEGWYANEVGGVTAPASLRASVADIPYVMRPAFAFRFSPAWALLLLLGVLLTLTAGAIATGALRLPGNAFSTDEMLISAENRILVVNVRTGASRNVAAGTIIAISPDRRRFLRYITKISNGSVAYECFVSDADGVDERKLDACGGGNASTATFSPDGAKALFYDGGFFIADLTTGHEKPLPWKESFKDTGTGGWSPDGRKIVIPARGQLVIADADGHQLGVISTRSYSYSFGPQWSPDGRSILFGTLYGSWVVLNAEIGGAIFGTEVMSGSGFFPAWSPDGTQIACISGNVLRVVDRDGRNVRLLDQHAYRWVVHWSPDGSRILYGSTKAISATLPGPMMVVDIASGASHAVSPVFSFNYAW